MIRFDEVDICPGLTWRRGQPSLLLVSKCILIVQHLRWIKAHNITQSTSKYSILYKQKTRTHTNTSSPHTLKNIFVYLLYMLYTVTCEPGRAEIGTHLSEPTPLQFIAVTSNCALQICSCHCNFMLNAQFTTNYQTYWPCDQRQRLCLLSGWLCQLARNKTDPLVSQMPVKHFAVHNLC